MPLYASKNILLILALAFVYFISAKIGLLLAFEQSNTSYVWPPTGIALAALILGGLRLWPGIFLGAFLVNMYVFFSFSLSFTVALGNTLEAVSAAYLILRFASSQPFKKTGETVVFIIALFASTMISASIGIGSLFIADIINLEHFLLLWKTWWIGDLVGGLVVTPFLLTWFRLPKENFTKVRLLEAAIILTVTLFIVSLVFGQWSLIERSKELMVFFLLPIIAWSSLRFHHHGVTLVVIVISTAAIIGTTNGLGPFILANESQSLLLLQAYIGSVMFTALLLMASLEERLKANRNMRLSQSNLEATITERTKELKTSNVLLANKMHQQNHITNSLKELLANIDHSSDKDFYINCAKTLANTYKTEFAFIGIFGNKTNSNIDTLAVWAKGAAVDNFTYDLHGSPCADALNHSMEIICKNAAGLYPDDELLTAMEIESYFGSPLKTVTGEVIGIIAVMDTKPLDLDPALKSILGLFSNKVAHELQRKITIEELELSESVFNESLEAIIVCDINAKIIRVNPEFTDITGYSSTEAIGNNIKFIRSGHHSKDFYTRLWTSLEDKGFWKGEMTNKRKNGEIFICWQIIKAIKDDAGNVHQYMSIFNDITEKKKAEEQIYTLAHHDLITQLPNRMSFQKSLNYSITVADNDTHQLAVMFIDLDHFKLINDTSGHPAGDELLQQVALRLKNVIGSENVISRFGGDEFTVLLPCIKSREEVATVANNILESLLLPFSLLSNEIIIGASIGIGLYPEDGKDASTLLSCADNAMYSAKKGGRASCQFYTNKMKVDAHERVLMERELRDALKNGEFFLNYQPQIDIRTNRFFGTEALIRWQHPTKGLIPPDKFIPVAEDTGLIVPIGQWVIEEACRQLQLWISDGLDDLTMAINLSARQFFQKDLLEVIERAMKVSNIPASKLEFEITESMMMDNIDDTIDILHKIKSIGVQLSIDDFGTGYSSLSYLKRFPLNKIKIDKSFIDGITDNTDDLSIVQAIISIAHSLNLTVIAEGVETDEQCRLLTQYQCNEIQGYFFSKPLAGLAAGNFLKERNIVELTKSI
jgi:diguanylate cyclase (GGDEF)-like protein/PAS domain S-box-containing protein